MNTFLKFYNNLGNNKGERFFRFLMLVFLIGLITVATINLGYDKSKGGLYWKPADISIHKSIGGSSNE
jgi:hypothetical protein